MLNIHSKMEDILLNKKYYLKEEEKTQQNILDHSRNRAPKFC